MFYQTVLKSVDKGRVIDVQGKNLTFIGYLSVQAGDSVWTDGKVIFGNAPPKSLPNIPIEVTGIPILCEVNEKKFKGYATRHGRLKKKKIIEDDWITYNEKNFEHGAEKIDEQKIIAAEIFEDDEKKKNNLYVVADGFYRKNQCVKYFNHLYIEFHNAQMNYVGKTQYAVLAEVEAYQGEEIKLGVESADVNKTAKIYKNSELIEEIDLQKYADFISEKCWDVEKDLMTLSENNNANYTRQPEPPNSFISSTYARIVSIKLNQNEDWDAIIFATASGYCFPYALFDGSVFEPIFNEENGSLKTFSAKLVKCLDYVEENIFKKNYFPFLEVEQYPAFSGEMILSGADLESRLEDLENRLPETARKYQGEDVVQKAKFYLKNQPALADETGVAEKCTSDYKNYIEAKLEYYIPRVRFKFAQWFPVIFGASCLLKVHNGEIISVMNQHSAGGNEILQEYEWNETKGTYYTSQRLKIPSETIRNEWEFPINANFQISGIGRTMEKIEKIIEGEKIKIADCKDMNLSVGKYLEILYSSLDSYYDHKDTTTSSLAESTGYPVEAFHNSYLQKLSAYYVLSDKDGTTFRKYAKSLRPNVYDPDGSYKFNSKFFQENFPNLENAEDYFLMEGFFDTESDDGFFRFNPVICELSGKNYLFGTHDGELLVKQDEVWKKIAEKLKNFSLCEMKNLNKAKTHE